MIAKEELVTILDHAKGGREEKLSEDPLQVPVELSEDWRPATVDGLPNCFCGEQKLSALASLSECMTDRRRRGLRQAS